MNCMNCGAFLGDTDLDYCPSCGCNVLIQKKVDHLSKFYYNQGLEKASIRDLSGAINCLKQSLTYDKKNIEARNLLGLVYFETGEVVAALSEWVISKNLRPARNLASEYIDQLQANPNKLEAINETIKKYNNALALCREGHEDMAAIQLKKILAQNSKLIKGYHLLALIQMKNHEWNKARKTLRRAARIDKTNTTTLRFLREVDEQTGTTTKLEHKGKGIFGIGAREQVHDEEFGSELVVQPPAYKEKSRISLFVTLMTGVAAGAAALWFLAVPAIRQGIYREANHQIVKYSESLASQGAELSKAQGEAQMSDDTAEAAAKQIALEKRKSQSLEALFNAYNAMVQEDYNSAALSIQQVYEGLVPDSLKGIYNNVCNTTGVTGIKGDGSEGDDRAGAGDESGSKNSKTSGGDNNSGSGSSDYGSSDSGNGDSGYGNSDYGNSDYGDSGYGDGDNGYGNSDYGSGDNSYGDSGYDSGDNGYGDSGYGDGDNGYGDSGYGNGDNGYGNGNGDNGYGDSGDGGNDGYVDAGYEGDGYEDTGY